MAKYTEYSKQQQIPHPRHNQTKNTNTTQNPDKQPKTVVTKNGPPLPTTAPKSE